MDVYYVLYIEYFPGYTPRDTNRWVIIIHAE